MLARPQKIPRQIGGVYPHSNHKHVSVSTVGSFFALARIFILANSSAQRKAAGCCAGIRPRVLWGASTSPNLGKVGSNLIVA